MNSSLAPFGPRKRNSLITTFGDAARAVPAAVPSSTSASAASAASPFMCPAPPSGRAPTLRWRELYDDSRAPGRCQRASNELPARCARHRGRRARAGHSAPGFMRWRRSALRFRPVVADADVHRERRVEVVGAAHLGADEIAYLRNLHVGHLEQQLVVHLQDEACAPPLLAQPAGEAD